jgi:predicted RNase H-like HicB family nuclease
VPPGGPSPSADALAVKPRTATVATSAISEPLIQCLQLVEKARSLFHDCWRGAPGCNYKPLNEHSTPSRPSEPPRPPQGAEGTNDSAYAPDLPGCIATGATREDVEREMPDTIEMHLDGLRNAGQPIPEPSALRTACINAAA